MDQQSPKVTIRILGVGCRKCNKAVRRAREAVRRLGIDAEVLLVKDINEISRWVMLTPGVLIQGKIVAEGYVPTVEMFESWLQISQDQDSQTQEPP